VRYSQGFTTDFPEDDELERLKQSRFRNHEKDYSVYLQVLKALGITPGVRVIDFGCSWGYGTWQLQQAGYQVQGYEISQSRANYGIEKLRVPIVTSAEQIKGNFDVFFSAHVLEHVPSVQNVVTLARNLLKPKGIFIAFTPNGSAEFRRRDERRFRKLWGMVHPNVLDDEFYRTLFSGNPLVLASSPYDTEGIAHWKKSSLMVLSLAGDELMAASVL